MTAAQDKTGRGEAAPRIVSLVPSLTEAIAACPGGLDALVGATDWCTHPTDLDDHGVTRIGGTKNPNVAKIAALQPTCVVANEEENREPDVVALRDAGLTVHVTHIRTVAGALAEFPTMFAACGLTAGDWLTAAEAAWRPLMAAPPQARHRAVVMIWRRPWMAVGGDTYTGDVLRLMGVENVFADCEDRYPTVDPVALPEHDLVVLPDEPYYFTAQDGPEAFREPSVLVSGRLLTWYGPAMMEAATALRESFAQ